MKAQHDDTRICARKKPYPGPQAARRDVRVMQRWGKGHAELLNVYRCTSCGRWHVGRDYDRRR
jgi:hypothetical protein